MKLNKLFLIDKRIIRCSSKRLSISTIDLHYGKMVVESFRNVDVRKMHESGMDETSVIHLLKSNELRLNSYRSLFIIPLN